VYPANEPVPDPASVQAALSRTSGKGFSMPLLLLSAAAIFLIFRKRK